MCTTKTTSKVKRWQASELPVKGQLTTPASAKKKITTLTLVVQRWQASESRLNDSKPSTHHTKLYARKAQIYDTTTMRDGSHQPKAVLFIRCSALCVWGGRVHCQWAHCQHASCEARTKMLEQRAENTHRAKNKPEIEGAGRSRW